MNAAQRRLAEGILFTDAYQLTMAQVYFRNGIHETLAQFDHFFRANPDYGTHRAGYCISAGLGSVLEWMRESRFGPAELDVLRAQRSRAGRPLFEEDFLQWLSRYGNFESITLRAIPEGRVVHPHVPLTIVEGPLATAQLLETALLNQINFQTLIATKASRVRESCQGRLLLEFGARRAQDRAAIAGARAALIGGADFSSNVGASAVLGYPPKGTHAHSMVQAFIALGGSEYDAFRAYAELYPDDCVLLVDTIDTLHSGLPNAIRVFEELRRKGHRPVGVRLDSGDLAHLSIQVARELDAAGFPDAVIVLSNQLDELLIWQITSQIQEEAPRYGMNAEQVIRRLVYGVGTSLITSAGSAALDGVYKLVSLWRNSAWMPAIKISETPAKTLNPGNKRVWRIYDQRGMATADLLTLEHEDPRQQSPLVLRHPSDHTKFRILQPESISEIELLTVEVLRQGQLCVELGDIEAMRQVRQRDVARLDPGVRRLINPHGYHVSLSQSLWELKQQLIGELREWPLGS
ncbi:MAG: nicotinate phosphoribosyltransferase [Thermoflexales bacterium]